MILPKKKLRSSIVSTHDDPFIVGEYRKAGHEDRADQLLGQLVTGSADIGLESMVSGVDGGLFAKGLKASTLALKDAFGHSGTMLSADEATARYGIDFAGESLLQFDDEISEEAARYKRDLKLKELRYGALSQRSLGESQLNWLPIIGGNLIGNTVDPGELLLGYATGGLASTKYLSLVGKGIENAKLRTITRGAIFGGVEGLAGEPLHYGLSMYVGEDYGWQDTMMNVAFSSGLGATVATGKSFLGEVDDLSDLSREDMMNLLEDKYRQIMEDDEISHAFSIMAGTDVGVKNANRDYIDRSVSDRIAATEVILKRKLTDLEVADLRTRTEDELIPRLKREAKTSAETEKAKLGEPKEVTFPKAATDINYDTPESASAADAAVIENLKQEAERSGINIDRMMSSKTKEGTEKKAIYKTEEDEFYWPETALSVMNDVFPTIKGKFFPDELEAHFIGEYGAYDIDSNTVYLNKQNIRSNERAAETILHEAVTHGGLRALYKDDKGLNKFLNYAYKQNKTDVDKFIEEWGGEYEFNEGPDGILDATEEWIANHTAKRGAVSPGLMRTLIADGRRLIGVDQKSTDYVDSAMYRAMTKISDRRIESALSSALRNIPLDEENSMKIKGARDRANSLLSEFEEINARREELYQLRIELLNKSVPEGEIKAEFNPSEFESARQRGIAARKDLDLKILTLEDEFELAKKRGVKSRKDIEGKVSDLKAQERAVKGRIKAARDRVQAGRVKAQEGIRAFDRNLNIHDFNKSIRNTITDFATGKRDDLEGANEYELLKRKLEAQDRKGIENMEHAHRQWLADNPSPKSRAQYEALKSEYEKLEERSKQAAIGIAELEEEARIIADNHEAKNFKKVRQDLDDREAREDVRDELLEMGLDPDSLKFSKIRSSRESQKAHVKVSANKIKKDIETQFIDDALKATEELESIESFVNVRVDVGDQTVNKKVDTGLLIGAMKNAGVKARIIDDLKEIDDPLQQLAYFNMYIEEVVQQRIRQVEKRYLGMFRQGTKNYRKFFHHKGNILELTKAFYGEKATPEAVEIKNLMQRISKDMITEQNLHGGRTAFIDKHMIRRVYNRDKIIKTFGDKGVKPRKAKPEDFAKMRDRFVDWYMGRGGYETKYQRLDYDKMFPEGGFSEAKVEASLRGMFDAIVMDSDSRKTVKTHVTSADISKKTDLHRTIHFTKAEDEFFHHMNLGSDDIYNAFIQEIKDVATRTVLMRELGTNPGNMIEAHIIPAIVQMTDPDDYNTRKKIKKWVDPLQRSLKIIDRSSVVHQSVTFSKVASTGRMFTGIVKMGGLLFTSLPDISLRSLQLRNMDAGGDFVIDSFLGFSKIKSKSDKFVMENSLAQIEAWSQAGAVRYDPDDLGAATIAAKMSQFAFNVNGMNWWNKWLRDGFILGAVKRMGVSAAYSMDELADMGGAKFMVNSLKEAGISAKDWDLIRAQARYLDPSTQKSSAPAGRKTDVYLTSDLVEDMDTAQIREILGEKATDAQVQSYARSLSDKYGAFLSSQMDLAVLTPGVREQRLLGLKTVEGSVWNAMAKLFTQYKSYPLSMATKVLQTQGRRGGANFANGWAILSTAAFTITLTALSMQIRELISGRSMREWDDPAMWMDAIYKSGFGTVFLDIVVGAEDRNLTDLAVGPTLEWMIDSAELGFSPLREGYKAVADEDPDWSKTGAFAAKYVKNWLIPFATHPFMKAGIVDPVFNMTVDQFSPETLQKTNDWYEKRGQSYIFNSPNGYNSSGNWEEVLGGLTLQD